MRKVLLESPGIVRIVDDKPADLQAGQALVRFRSAGLCGSDLSAFRGTSPLVTYPRVLGHEVLVDVLEAPDQPELQGHRAVLNPMIPCGRCRACRLGRTNCCVSMQVMGVHVDGGLQDSRRIDLTQLFPVPDNMPDDVAVLAEPLTIAYHAVERSRIEAGQIGVVFGAGTIGLLIAQLLLRARGCRVLVIDVAADRLRIAESLGAIAVQGGEGALVRAVTAATNGDLADVVFEASGSAAATRSMTALVAHAGRIVLVGWNRGPVEVDTVTFMRKEGDMIASRNSVNAFPPVLRLLSDGVLDPSTFITHRFPLGEAARAIEALDKNQGTVLKILIENG